MSVLYHEIESCLQDTSLSDNGKISASIIFPETFSGFKGHFPENPVVPGVCKVLTIIVLLEKVIGKKCVLKNITMAKFASFVTCNQRVQINITSDNQDASFQRISAVFQSYDKKIAQIQLEVSYA